MKLSILICSLFGKREKFLDKLLNSLYPQIGEYKTSSTKGDYILTTITSKDVEILICTDKKQLRVGTKRNILIDNAKGDYISFVDDDDILSKDYVSSLLKGIFTEKDVVLFDVEISINNGKFKKVYYDANYFKDRNLSNYYERIPNHIMCWNRSIIDQRFPDISLGEDAQWAIKMRDNIKSQAKIPKTLYYYMFNSKSTETQ